MLEKQFLSAPSIINCLKNDYGIEVSTLTFLPIGADIDASVYKAETLDKTAYFVKIKRGHHDISAMIGELLQETGIQQIIPPIKTIQGQTTQPIKEFTLIVYPFVNGENGFIRDLTDDQWILLGKVMRQLHEINVPLSIQKQIRREDYSSKWREIVRSLDRNDEPIGDEIAVKLWKFMKENSQVIYRLVDRAEELAQQLQNQTFTFVLCHSDIHGGNVLIDEKGAIYIVDWDDPIMAPKERDLMFIGGGVANVWNKPEEEKLFYKGYGNTEVNPTILAYYRHERIVEDIAVYAQELLLTTAKGHNRPEMYKQFMDMFAPNGVVEIAFKTDVV